MGRKREKEGKIGMERRKSFFCVPRLRQVKFHKSFAFLDGAQYDELLDEKAKMEEIKCKYFGRFSLLLACLLAKHLGEEKNLLEISCFAIVLACGTVSEGKALTTFSSEPPQSSLQTQKSFSFSSSPLRR